MAFFALRSKCHRSAVRRRAPKREYHTPAAPYRPRRALLYLPGSNPRFLEKAVGLKADTLCLDLEDGVALSAKSDARNNIVAALQEKNYTQEVLV